MIHCKRIKYNRIINIESRKYKWSLSGQPLMNEYCGSIRYWSWSKKWAKSISGGELGKSVSRSGREITLCSCLMRG